MRICPKCGSLAYFNSYFGEFSCNKCSWKDDSFKRKRIELYVKSVSPDNHMGDNKKEQEIEKLVCV